jgi:hypothetical protein
MIDGTSSDYSTLAVSGEAEMKDAYEQWDALCKKFEAARDAHNNAQAAVTRGFARVAKRTGGNPSEDDLDAAEAAWQRLEDIKRRMDEFVKANT